VTGASGYGTGFASPAPPISSTESRGDVMRAILSCSLGLFLCCALSAEEKKGDEKIDAKKLVGKWSPKEEATFTVEFTKDGKATLITTTADGKGAKVEGTYKVDGNKLTATMKVDDKERTMIRTISKLTDTELVSTDEKGKEATLVRVKDKDK
jgi:uncharacterized protein (TIGR03066 family)